jgi:hypothetical protein
MFRSPELSLPFGFWNWNLYTQLLSTMLATIPTWLFFYIPSWVVCFSPSSWYSINSCLFAQHEQIIHPRSAKFKVMQRFVTTSSNGLYGSIFVGCCHYCTNSVRLSVYIGVKNDSFKENTQTNINHGEMIVLFWMWTVHTVHTHSSDASCKFCNANVCVFGINKNQL